MPISSEMISGTFLWSLALLFVRCLGLILVLPGIGGSNIPDPIRICAGFSIALLLAMAGVEAPLPQSLAEGGLMIVTELSLGYLLGLIPLFVISSLAVAGQVTSGAIGLGQANLIDYSLGESVSVISRLQMLVGTCLFLFIDGHHVVIRALAGGDQLVKLGMFRPDVDTAALLAERFVSTFQLAVVVSAPILVTLLLTQFVLGLITKSVPQVNIFVISLPLTIGIGLYIIEFTFPGMSDALLAQFSRLDHTIAALMAAS